MMDARIIGLLILLGVIGVYADDFGFGNKVSIIGAGYTDSSCIGRQTLRNELNISGSTGSSAKTNVTIEISRDQYDSAANFIRLKEGYVDLYLKTLDMQIGRQFIQWGTCDVFNPTDNFSRSDYSFLPTARDEKIAIDALSAKLYWGHATIHGVFVPTRNYSILPQPFSPWSQPLPQSAPNPFDHAHPLPIQYAFAMANYRNPVMDKVDAGIRLSESLRGIDFSLNFFHGADDLPVFLTTTSLSSDYAQVNAVVQPWYRRFNAIGGDVAGQLPLQIGLRAECAYTKVTNNHSHISRESFFNYAVGIDREFSLSLLGKSIRLLGEWTDELSSEDMTYSTLDLSHVLRHAIAAKVDYAITDYLSCAAQGMLNLEKGDSYLSPSVAYNFADGLLFTAAADVFSGESDTFFGAFSKRTVIRGQCVYELHGSLPLPLN